jgi:hypothetical protein
MKVTCLEDAADHLVGPAGSLVLLSLLWRGRTATVPLVRQAQKKKLVVSGFESLRNKPQF